MSKFLIDEVEVSENEFWSKLDSAIEDYCEENFADWLDDVYDEVEIMGISYPFSEVLEKVDYVLYREVFRDYMGSEHNNIQSEIGTTDGYTLNGLLFRVKEVSEQLNYKVYFDIAVIGNNQQALKIIDNVTNKSFMTYEEAVKNMEDIATTLHKENLITFTDIGDGIERHCIAFRLTKSDDRNVEQILDYFLIELDESKDKNHRKEMKN